MIPIIFSNLISYLFSISINIKGKTEQIIMAVYCAESFNYFIYNKKSEKKLL